MGRRAATSSVRVMPVAVSVVLALAACGTQPAPEPTQLASVEERVHIDPADAAAVPDLVAAADALGLALVGAAGDVTTVTSPASLQVTLSMAAEGLRDRP